MNFMSVDRNTVSNSMVLNGLKYFKDIEETLFKPDYMNISVVPMSLLYNTSDVTKYSNGILH